MSLYLDTFHAVSSKAFFENVRDDLTLKLRNSFWGGQIFVKWMILNELRKKNLNEN